MKHISLVTSNEYYGEALRRWLEESGHTADVHLVDTVEGADLVDHDALILDAHATRPKQVCGAVDRVRAAREGGTGTPFVILTWLPFRRAIVNPRLASNPFIGHYYRDSCRFLRLPVRPERLVEVLGEVRPCTKEEIDLGKQFMADIDHAHRPSDA